MPQITASTARPRARRSSGGAACAIAVADRKDSASAAIVALISFPPSGSRGNARQRRPHIVEREHHAREVESDEKRLAQQPDVLSGYDRRVVETRPDQVEDEVAGIADGKHAEQPDDTEDESRTVPRATIVRNRCRQHLRQPKRDHAEASRLYGGHRQCPRE